MRSDPPKDGVGEVSMRLIVASLIRGAAPQNPRSPVRRHEGIFTQLKRKGSVNFSEATKFTVRAVTSNKKNRFRPHWTLGREGSGHRPRPPNDAKFPCLRCGLGWGRCPAHSHASPTRERGNPRPSAVRRAAFPCWRCGLGWERATGSGRQGAGDRQRVWMGRRPRPNKSPRRKPGDREPQGADPVAYAQGFYGMVIRTS